MQLLTALFLSLFATVCFGSAIFLTSQSAKKMDPVRTGFLFQLTGMPAAFLLLPFAPHVTHIAYIPIILIGIYQTFAMLLWYYALRVGNVSLVSSVGELYSLLSVLLGVIVLHETIGVYRFFGIALMFGGGILVGFNWSEFKKNRKGSLHKGVVPALIYSGLLAVFFLFAAISARENGWFVSAFGIRATIVAVSLVILLLQKKNIVDIFKNVPWKWIATAGMIDGVGFGVFSLALTLSQVSYVTMITSGASIVTILLAYIFLKEKLLLYQLIGVVGVVIGLLFLQLH